MNWYILALLSALFSAFAAILEKKALFKESALYFSFLLAISNLIFSLPFFFSIQFEELQIKSLTILYLKTILGTASFLMVMMGLKRLEIGRSLPLLTLSPAIVAVFAFIFLNEKLSIWQTLGMLGLLSGTYVIQLGEKKDLLEPFKVFFKSKGHHYILIALALFTITSLLDKHLLKNLNLKPYTFMAFQHLFLALNFSLLLILLRGKLKISYKINTETLVIVVLISAFTIVYRYTQIEAVKMASVALVLSLKRISVFIATLLGGKIFNESYLLRKSIASLIMVIGAALVILF